MLGLLLDLNLHLNLHLLLLLGLLDLFRLLLSSCYWLCLRFLLDLLNFLRGSRLVLSLRSWLFSHGFLFFDREDLIDVGFFGLLAETARRTTLIHDALYLTRLRHILQRVKHVGLRISASGSSHIRGNVGILGSTQFAVETLHAFLFGLASYSLRLGSCFKGTDMDSLDLSGGLLRLSTTSLIHSDHVLGVGVDSETDELRLEVKDAVKVAQEQVSKDVDVVVLLVERVLCNRELADALALVQISLWTHLKDSVPNVEANWLEFGSSRLTSANRLAEDLLPTVQLDCALPLLSEGIELISWDGDERTASVDDGSVLLRLLAVAKRHPVVHEVFSWESPRLDSTLIVSSVVPESGQTSLTADNLRGVVASKESVWLVSYLAV